MKSQAYELQVRFGNSRWPTRVEVRGSTHAKAVERMMRMYPDFDFYRDGAGELECMHWHAVSNALINEPSADFVGWF